MRNNVGVNKKRNKSAVLAEAGEYPILVIDICKNFMKHWIRMKSIDENSLLYSSFQEN